MGNFNFRMIRKGEENTGNNEVVNETPCIFQSSDKALWKPSGWVHVEKEIDFNDPKVKKIISIRFYCCFFFFTN